jgi:hypothetical protein
MQRSLLFCMTSLMIRNCQATRHKLSKASCRELVGAHKPAALVIVEPRIRGCYLLASKFIKSSVFPRTQRIKASGFSGGIWLIRRDDLLQVDILVNHKRKLLSVFLPRMCS